MSWFIYYILTMSLNAISVILFYNHINITLLSIVPVALFLLMIFEGVVLRTEKIENGFKTAFCSNFNTEEENLILIYSSNSLFTLSPFLIPFVLFFPSLVKLISLLVFVMGFALGAVVFRIKNKNKIIERYEAEREELNQQKKNEELGKWK